MARLARWTPTCVIALLLCATAACREADPRTTLVIAGSAVGAEGEALRERVAAFERLHGDVRVEIRGTPDAGDERRQLYVQWFAAGAAQPDLLQVDVVWTPELAAAGFLAPLERDLVDGFLPAAIAASEYEGGLFAAPWFVDVGLLYWRTDRMKRAPATLEELRDLSADRGGGGEPGAPREGFVWQGARYEGLVCVFLEVLTGMGGAILDDHGDVVVDSPAGVRALAYLVDTVGTMSPAAVTGWQEEHARFSFQNGDALMMRNWPYAAPLLRGAQSRVGGRFGTVTMPGDVAGRGAAALGGQALAVNKNTKHPALARELLAFLVDDEAQLARARIAGQYPPRLALYDAPQLAAALPIEPASARAILERAVARPPSPVWTELSGVLQIQLHRALTRQLTPERAMQDAAREMRTILVRAQRDRPQREGGPAQHSQGLVAVQLIVGLACLTLLALGWLSLRAAPHQRQRDARFGWRLATPALFVLAVVGGGPLLATLVQSLHDVDLRQPWRGAPFVGLELFGEIASSSRFWAALAHTAAFTAVTVTLELVLGLALALLLHRVFVWRGAVRAVTLLPWAIPAVVGAVVWRFLFEALGPGVVWAAHPVLAWVPIVAADVWKTTPFVALILSAGLAQIDPSLLEAAKMDGASAAARFFRVVLPLLRPAMLVAVIFRTLDAFRVFDLVYVLTGGGPGTATEVVSLLAFDAMMRNLRFGAGAAISVVVFAIAFALALVYVRVVGDEDRP